MVIKRTSRTIVAALSGFVVTGGYADDGGAMSDGASGPRVAIPSFARNSGGGSGMYSAGEGCPLAPCSIEFDEECPDVGELCGALFTGGESCVIDFLPFCYNSGDFSYRVDPRDPLTITLSGDLVSLEVFFADIGISSGEMRFFNADDLEVGEPLVTNGDCTGKMLPLQSRVFEEPVRRIEVTASGAQVYIDTFSVNPGFEPPVADLDGDCSVGTTDLLILLGAWGPCDDCADCPADLDRDCNVGSTDLIILLGNWG